MQLMNMPHLSCRGEAQRQTIIENYDLLQIAFNKLINGDSFSSDAGGKDIFDRYYMFEAKSKSNPDDVYAIVCGAPTGQDFLRLLNVDSMPLFNPLVSHSETLPTDGNKKSEDKQYIKKWNPAMYQLYNAACLIPICWKQIIRGGLLSTKVNCLKYYYSEPYWFRVKTVNNVIQQDFKNRTLTEMINEELRTTNNIREFKFDLLTQILQKEGIKSFF